METWSIFIEGKVQGVFFRQHTKDFAIDNKLTGFVENLEDGRVHIMATGSAEQLDKLKQWCFTGSPRSKVTSVNYLSIAYTPFTSFRIKR